MELATRVRELKLGALPPAFTPSDTGASMSISPRLAIRTAPACCNEATRPEPMFRVSADVPDPTKATLPELNDQLAPFPLRVPASVTSPGASMANAPPEFNVEPSCTEIVAAGVGVDALLGGTTVLVRHVPVLY